MAENHITSSKPYHKDNSSYLSTYILPLSLFRPIMPLKTMLRQLLQGSFSSLSALWEVDVLLVIIWILKAIFIACIKNVRFSLSQHAQRSIKPKFQAWFVFSSSFNTWKYYFHFWVLLCSYAFMFCNLPVIPKHLGGRWRIIEWMHLWYNHINLCLAFYFIFHKY